MTTARKAVTLLLSYLLFTKPLTEQHGTGLLLIAMGIIIKLLPDNKPQKRVSTPIEIRKVENPSNEEEMNRLINDDDEERRHVV